MREQGSGNGGSPGAAAGAPARAGLVLGTLILVAAVANLNLAVANVALPSIGAAFDSSQTTLEPHRRGLLARARGLRAVARRARRPVRTQAHADPRDGLGDPVRAARRVRPERHRAVRRSGRRRVVRGDGVPDDAGADHRAVVRPSTDEVDRAVVGDRGCRRGAGADVLRPAARALLVGVGLPDHVAARGRGAGPRRASRPCTRERGDRTRRQPRRRPVGAAGRCLDPRDQLRGRAERGNPRRRSR